MTTPEFQVDDARLTVKYREAWQAALNEAASLRERLILVEAAFDQVSDQLRQLQETHAEASEDEPPTDQDGRSGEDPDRR